MAKEKEKSQPHYRQVKPKLNLSVHPVTRIGSPHDDLIRPETLPSQPSQSSLSPQKDFTKVANSISREAVPKGMFKGKSKQLYDYLYSQTRGAIVPKRVFRITRPKLMRSAGIGAKNTLDVNIAHLKAMGLIQVTMMDGNHLGNQYEVFLPEEIDLTLPSQPSVPSQPSPTQKLASLASLETSQAREAQTVETTAISGNPNTSFKTTTDDDDGVNLLAEAIRQTAEEIIGVKLPQTEQERERWRQCGTILAEELRSAALRAGNVSSVPAFLAAHLKRRFKTGQTAKPVERPNAELTKSQAASLSKEQRFLKMIKELQQLHIGDAGYQEQDLREDLKYKCERNKIAWDEELVNKLLSSKISHKT
jgi:hypothetical protein